jgi:hypothetical protein
LKKTIPFIQIVLRALSCGLVLVPVFFLIDCGRNPDVKETKNILTFNVDGSLLSAGIQDSVLLISFQSPKGWHRLPRTIIEKAQQSAQEKFEGTSRGNASHSLEVRHAWNDTTTGGVMTVSRLTTFDPSDSSRTIREYENLYRESTPDADIKKGVFYTNGLKVHQLRCSSFDRVLFKMVFTNERLPYAVQFDFSIPRDTYQQLIRTIESVTGSVVPM